MLGSVISLGVLLGSTLLGQENSTEAKLEMDIKINGVEFLSEFNHFSRGEIYVDVEKYTETVGVKYEYDGSKKIVTIGNSKTVKTEKNRSVITAPLAELADAAGSEEITYENESKSSVYVLDLPDGAVKYHPPMDAMGQHWIVLRNENGEKMTDAEVDRLGKKKLSRLEKLVNFPDSIIYGTWEGKLIFLEQMVSIHGTYADEAFYDSEHYYHNEEVEVEGEKERVILPAHEWNELDGMEGKPSPAVEHTDMGVQPVGHPGFEVPHYDIHHYFISHEEHEAIEVHEEGTENHMDPEAPIKEEYMD